MYIVRFVRKDNQPCEEYYYHKAEDAEYHISLFRNDDSGLYLKIEYMDSEANRVLQELRFTSMIQA